MPPLPPPMSACPLCESSDVKFVRQYDNYPTALGGGVQPPTSTVFIFECACGCSFAMTVPIAANGEADVETRAIPGPGIRKGRS